MKFFATMLELPLFILSIYVAVVLNDLIHGIADYFGKQSILAMLDTAENSNAIGGNGGFINQIFSSLGSKMVLYLFDGFMELAVSAICIIVVYKVVISFHNSILDSIEVQGLKGIDGVADTLKNEGSSWGSKI